MGKTLAAGVEKEVPGVSEGKRRGCGCLRVVPRGQKTRDGWVVREGNVIQCEGQRRCGGQSLSQRGNGKKRLKTKWFKGRIGYKRRVLKKRGKKQHKIGNNNCHKNEHCAA